MTNLQLIVMISAYCGTKDFDNFKNTDTYRNQVTELLDDGMIVPNLDQPKSEFSYHLKITDKGRVWLDAVLALSYPVKITEWRMPNV